MADKRTVSSVGASKFSCRCRPSSRSSQLCRGTAMQPLKSENPQKPHMNQGRERHGQAPLTGRSAQARATAANHEDTSK